VSKDGQVWAGLESLVEEAMGRGVSPGVVLLVGRGEDVIYQRGWGRLGLGENPDLDSAVIPATRFDVASLSKPLATFASLVLLMAEGRLLLGQPVADFFPGFGGAGPFSGAGAGGASVTVSQLLTHSSGLPDWVPYFKAPDFAAAGPQPFTFDKRRRRRLVAEVARQPLVYEPGSESRYSDLGFILLGDIVEQITGEDLDEFITSRLLQPLGTGAGFRRPGSGVRGQADAEVPPCGICGWRQRLVQGQVQDENAWLMGGVAGHAGLFASARDIHLLAAEYEAALAGNSVLLDSRLLRHLLDAEPSVPGSTWLPGWDTPTPGASTAGSLVGARALGHLGYTGSSLWIDRDRGVHVVLLSNRVHPHTGNRGIAALRPAVHDAVFECVDSLSRQRSRKRAD